jgi:hypothetical protein
MKDSSASTKPGLSWGMLSLVLSPLGLLLVFYFASAGGWGIVQSRRVIIFAQYLLIALLGSGLLSGIVGLARREEPKSVAVSGLIVTISVTLAIALFFASLDD